MDEDVNKVLAALSSGVQQLKELVEAYQRDPDLATQYHRQLSQLVEDLTLATRRFGGKP